MNDPLLPHLLDIASEPVSQRLILAGGFGMRLKQQHLTESGARTLVDDVPAARSTQDLDLFLRMDLFTHPDQGRQVRSLLVDRLGYEIHTPKWQFGKPATPFPGRVMVDLLARTPEANEPVRVKDTRVGLHSGINLHGRATPEAFAIEERPLMLPVSGTRTDGTEVSCTIQVPHPYAWLNMKVMAAYDWWSSDPSDARKENRRKHAFDVYLLTAMLTPNELDEAADLARRFEDHPVARQVRAHARQLFGATDAPGCLETVRQSDKPLDFGAFGEALALALRLSDQS